MGTRKEANPGAREAGVREGVREHDTEVKQDLQTSKGLKNNPLRSAMAKAANLANKNDRNECNSVIETGKPQAASASAITDFNGRDVIAGSVTTADVFTDTVIPLYQNQQLAKHPNAIVVVCEGEDATRAASRLLPPPRYVCTTWLSDSVKDAGWSALRDREVWLWPRRDLGGITAMNQAFLVITRNHGKAHELDQALFTNDFGQQVRRPELPEHFDAVVAEADGWSPQSAMKLLDAARREAPYTVRGFEVSPSGVRYAPGEDKEKKWICDRLDVRALSDDGLGEGWGKVLEWKDARGRQKRMCMPMSLLGSEPSKLCALLLDKGLNINPDMGKYLIRYLSVCKPDRIMRSVQNTGWHRTSGQAALVFVSKSECFGAASDQIIYQGGTGDSLLSSGSGSLDEYKESILRLCEQNSRLVLSVGLALAAPLLYLVKEDSGGVHLRGDSSNGKTTTLLVGCSVFGNPNSCLKTWRTTDNAIESIAASHCDLPLFLDELAQVRPEIAGDIAYTLGNGQAKARQNKDGTNRSPVQWRLLFMSTGEISLYAHMQTSGKTSTAGQEHRMLDIPADAGAKLGVFEHLHGAPDGAAFADQLKASSREFYGTLGREWISSLSKNDAEAERRVKELRSQFIAALQLDPNATRQVHRAANRFALIAAAAQLATEWNLTGWQDGTAFSAVENCFKAWVGARGTTDDLERKRLLEHVRLFFQKHAEDRFTRVGMKHPDGTRDRVNEQSKTANRAGWVSTTGDYMVQKDVFERELCNGCDKRYAIRTLLEAGYLEPNEENGRLLPTTPMSNPDTKKTIRVYKFTNKVFGE